MTFFESLLVLMLAAILLLQVSRRLQLPYPSMLALAGAAVALIPGAPNLPIDPHTALALFIAPALMDAAFDFPVGTAKRFWLPLLAYAVGGVLVTAALVAWVGWAVAGLPVAAALVLGAIVAPPDAAAATAILSAKTIPRTTDAILRGESLFNDATALLLFGAALAVQRAGGLGPVVALQVMLAAPGGMLLGFVWAHLNSRINRFVAGTLGGVMLQFVSTFMLWILAERLGLSAVLAVVTSAMTIASFSATRASARMRVHSYAVWGAVVFVLNVLAFLLMGMQARGILAALAGPGLQHALAVAGLVVAVVIASRMVIATGFNRAYTWYLRSRGEPEQATIRQALLAGWCGMRGLVTLATAFALPEQFPQRNLVVLTAFAVVLATLVVQGMTLGPVIRLLGLDRQETGGREYKAVERDIAAAALAVLDDAEEEEARPLRAAYAYAHSALHEEKSGEALERYRHFALAAVAAQRDVLEKARGENRLNVDEYNALLEDIDWRELTVLPDEGRRIEES